MVSEPPSNPTQNLVAAMSIIPSATTSPAAVAIAGTTSSSFSIKLNSTNYLAWKTQFGPLLNLQPHHGFIDGIATAPSKTIPTSSADATLINNLAYEAWFKKDQMLLSWLLSSLFEEVFPFVFVFNHLMQYGIP
jgi:hypothetical protein